MHTRIHTHTLCPPERAAFFFSSVEVWVGQREGGRELMLSTTTGLSLKNSSDLAKAITPMHIFKMVLQGQGRSKKM